MPMVKLGEVAREYKETCKGDKGNLPIVGLEHLIPENINLTCWSDDKENTFTKMFRKGHVLFGRRRAYLKKAAVAPFDGICSGDITVIEAIGDKLYPGLLPFIIQNDALFDFAVGKSAGSLSPRVKWQHLQDYEFFLPEMAKQKELAELLWAMDRTKQAYKQLISATDELVKSQFIEMFGSGGYKERLIKELYEVKSSKRIYAKELSTDNGIPFLKVADLLEKIQNGSCTPKTYISEERYSELQRSGNVPTKGDILVTSRGTIGDCYIVKEEDRFYFQDGMISWLHPKKQCELLSEFTVSLFSTDALVSEMNDVANKTTVLYLSLDKLAGLHLICPAYTEQAAYLDFVRQTDKSKFELNQALEALNATYKKLISENLG